jgi:hypothetical protein
MNIKLYEYGLEQSLDAMAVILRGALGNKVSKKYKDLKISEALGIVDTLCRLTIVDEQEDKHE